MSTLKADFEKPLTSLADLYTHLSRLSDPSYLRQQKIESYIYEKVRVVGEIRRLVETADKPRLWVRYAEKILNKSPYLPHDISEAENYLLMAANQDFAQAHYFLLTLYSGGFDYGYEAELHSEYIEKHQQALKGLESSKYAEYYLGRFLFEQNIDMDKGLKLIDKAVANQVPEALAYMAELFMSGVKGKVEKDGKKAYVLFRRAYDRCVINGEDRLDNPILKYEILYRLGCMYINGWGVMQNGHTGRCLVFKAAERFEKAEQYCGQFLGIDNNEYYIRMQEEVSNLDVDGLLEGGSPSLAFCKSNRNGTLFEHSEESDNESHAQDEAPNLSASDMPEPNEENEDALAFITGMSQPEDFDPMSIFSDPKAKIDVYEYDDFNHEIGDYESRSGNSHNKTDNKYRNTEAQFTKDVETRAPKISVDMLSAKELDKVFEPLDSLVGLSHIKKEVRSLVNLVQLNRMRATKKLPEIPMSMHMVFSGPPGTGKTTVAKLIGDILWEIGYLPSGHVVDVSRHDIIGEYIGWTASLTAQALDAARGGILFLDEAYMLSNSDSPRDFGTEAIDTINKYMEDYRDDLIVIAAGYKDEMQGFLNSNPGLKSRFKHELDFKPMEKDQLYAVYEAFCKQYQLTLDEEAASLLDKVLYRAHRQGEFSKSNARGIRDMFERMLVNQAQRLSENVENVTESDLQTIMKQDIYLPETLTDGNITFLSSKKDD